MKRFIKWLRRHTSQQSITNEADQRVKAGPEQKKEDEYSDVSSNTAAGWNESSGPGTDAPKPDQCDHEDTVPHTTLELEDAPMSDAEEDAGIDPYNTGRFDTENK